MSNFEMAQSMGPNNSSVADSQYITRNPRTLMKIKPANFTCYSLFMNFQELWKALEEVEMKSKIHELPDSLNTVIVESGNNFSIGQKQLLCLARALIHHNKILFLDEATSNVDPHTDSLIQKTIRAKFAECTVLTVAHRLHTVMDSDKVLVMDNGKVVEFDNPEELLKMKDGYFYSLVRQAPISDQQQQSG